MSVKFKPEEMFLLSVLGVTIEDSGDETKLSIEELASKVGITEQELRSWMEHLREKGKELFSSLKPGMEKKYLSSSEVSNELELQKAANRISLMLGKDEGKQRLKE